MPILRARLTFTRPGLLLLMLGGVALLSACSPRPPTGEIVPWDQLITALGEPLRIADLDSPGAGILTSHDRTQGNNDFNNVIGTDQEGWEILADLEGPGYVSRLWMTGIPEDHRIQFFFDGERTPRIDTTVETLAGTGEKPPFLRPLCLYEQLCFLMQVPIPFEKGLVVRSQPREIDANGWPRMFYQLEHRALPEGKTIESFPTALPPRTLGLLRSICDQWESEAFSPKLPDVPNLDHHLEVPPGGTAEVRLAPDSGIIQLLQLRLHAPETVSARARDHLLRQIRLQAYWDESEHPSIDVPLGDFFGSPWYSAHFQSMFFGQSDGVFFSRFPMPYARGARFAVVNEGTVPVTLDLGFDIRPAPSAESDLGYFHAAWNRSTPAEVGQPHRVLQATGRGAYAGCILTVASQANSWWILESDETIWIDQDPDAYWQGTGLEDYFNGGWYYQFAQVRPTHGVLYKAPFRTVQFRTHPADPIHFTSGIDMQFERGPDNASPGWMESTAFYYLGDPQPAASSIPAPDQRTAPVSPAGKHTLMTELTNRERLGDLAGAIHAIDAYLERFPDVPQEILRLRQLAYRERMEGLEAVKEAYTRIAAQTEHPASAKQAQDLLWFHEDPSHALLSVFCRNKTVVHLDGKPIVQAMAPRQIFVFRATLDPGPHVLALEAETSTYPEWVLTHRRTHHGNVPSLPDWKFSYTLDGAWKKPGFDDADWVPMKGNGGKGPPEIPFVYLEPNAHVLSLAESRGLRPRGPAREEQGTFGFRKEFEIPE